jgi:polysaccharide export outer membrane protein
MLNGKAGIARGVCLVALTGALCGCATLPASGPTRHQIEREQKHDNPIGFTIVEINQPVVTHLAAEQQSIDDAAPTLASLTAQGRYDTVGPGDALAISIYEVGFGLFGNNRGSAEAFDPSARGENFPSIVIDRNGEITIPYVGRLLVAGHTTDEIQGMITQRLRGLSQNPQAVVFLKENLSNTVFVGGDVRRPGRFDLSLRKERLLDAIASAGGASYLAEDTIVRFARGGKALEERLGRIRAGAADDLELISGDRIELIKRPRSYIMLGATSKVSQVPFEFGDLSLAEAIARAGGPTDSAADPSAIFVFRYVSSVSGSREETPVVYRINMMKPASYFLAQRFAIRDKDVVYIANAAANQPAKLVSILNQLFSPFITARALTQ